MYFAKVVGEGNIWIKRIFVLIAKKAFIKKLIINNHYSQLANAKCVQLVAMPQKSSNLAISMNGPKISKLLVI